MSDDETHRHRGPAHEGQARTSPYPVSRLAPAVELVDLARQIDHADELINVRASAKLRVIAEQIKSLQAQARSVLEEVRHDQDLHRAQCSFKRIPGHVYHLYRRADGTRYFSMLSPDDWRGRPPHDFEGTYRLEPDMSWTEAGHMDDPDDTAEIVARLLVAPADREGAPDA